MDGISTASRQIELVQSAYALVGDALNRFNEYIALAKHGDDDTRRAFHAVMERLTNICESLAKERNAARERFNGVALLQATIRHGERSMRIAVAKPDDRCDEPFVHEASYIALRTRLGATEGAELTTDEVFPVCVLSRSGRICAVIAPEHLI